MMTNGAVASVRSAEIETPELHIAEPGRAERVFQLKRDNRERLFGRSRYCDEKLTDELVSSRHAAFRAHDREVFVVDVGSKHGTFVNGHRIGVEQNTSLRDGDEIRIGDTVIRLVCYTDRLREVFDAVDGLVSATKLKSEHELAPSSPPIPPDEPPIGAPTSSERQAANAESGERSQPIVGNAKSIVPVARPLPAAAKTTVDSRRTMPSHAGYSASGINYGDRFWLMLLVVSLLLISAYGYLLTARDLSTLLKGMPW